MGNPRASSSRERGLLSTQRDERAHAERDQENPLLRHRPTISPKAGVAARPGRYSPAAAGVPAEHRGRTGGLTFDRAVRRTRAAGPREPLPRTLGAPVNLERSWKASAARSAAG